MNIICQGDVMLYPVDAIPDGAEAKAGNRHVLALGEITGHSHVLERASMAVLDGTRYVYVEDGGALYHEDHGPIAVPAGTYKVIQQQEPDLLGAMRNVID